MKPVAFGKNEVPLTFYKFHTHPEWEIVLQLSGHVTTTVGDHTFLLSKGDIMIIPPGTAHSGISDAPFTNIFFRVETLDFPGFFTVHDTDSGVLYLMKILYKLLCKGEKNDALLIESITDSIYQYISKYAGENKKYPFVSQLKDTICTNLDNPDFDLAKEIGNTGFCPDYLRRCFKADTDMTPLEYLTWLRLSLAKKLLVEESFAGIANVALRCGFRDSFYFSTCFKKYVGCTPSQYRKCNI